mgnify:FL=1
MLILQRWLRGRWSVPLIALLGVALNLPGLGARLTGDDFLQWSLLTADTPASPPRGSLFGLFDLVKGGAAYVQAMKDSGRLLWTAADTLHMSFWRPVSEFSHWLDYQLWPDSPALMHAHSLLWYAVLVLMLGNFYRLLDRNRTRGSVAIGLYAISGLHFYAIAWLAARNQLISTCFTVAALTCHHLWRTGKGRRYAALAMGLTMLGLASAEAAVATLAYLAAYEWALQADRRWRDRALALLPYVLIVVAWRLFYNHAGYGAMGSGSYIDPGSTPGRFGLAVVLRLPALLLAQLTGASAAIPQFFSLEGKVAYAMAATAAALLMAWILHGMGLWRHALMRFYGLGTLLALVPICAIESNDRVLINAEIGMNGMLALLVYHLATKGRQARLSGIRPRLVRAGAMLIIGIHALLFPIACITGAWITRALIPVSYAQPLSLPDAAGTPGVHMIVVNPPLPGLLYYYPMIRRYAGMHNPASIQALATGLNQDLSLTVLDDHTIRLRSGKAFQEPLMRDLVTLPFKPGDTVRMGQVQVVVETINKQGAPMSARFRFDQPLRDPTWAFYVWQDTGYVPLTWPTMGHTLYLPAMDMKKAMWNSVRHTP